MSRRILVIDDEADIREVAQLSLEMTAGWEVRTAGSGTEGAALAAADRPDAVLLDVMMPGVDGPGTVALLRADPATADVPVILLTAKVQAADRRRFQELPVSGLLSKPFDPMLLADQVRELLGWEG